MAASSSPNSSLGVAPFVRFGGTPTQQIRASPVADNNLHFCPPLNVDSSIRSVISRALPGVNSDAKVVAVAPNNHHACGLVSFAFAATAWAGLSLYPLEALATVYDTDHHHRRVVTSTVTGDPLTISSRGELFMEKDESTAVQGHSMLTSHNVPSIELPNEGLNSPWIPNINGFRKRATTKKAKAAMHCPPWTMSELQMVLPDYQGKPKPFPRMQGNAYPFWPAINMLIVGKTEANNGSIERAFDEAGQTVAFNVQTPAAASMQQLYDYAPHTDKHDGNPMAAAPPHAEHPGEPIKRPTGCFTM